MRTVLVIAALFAPPSVSAQLCPPDTGKPNHLRMTESTFSDSAAARSLQYFKTDVPALLAEFKDAARLQSVDRYYIGYPNSIRILEGWFLRTKAEAALSALEITKLRAQRIGGVDDLPKRQGEYEAARKRFCDFVAQSYNVD